MAVNFKPTSKIEGQHKAKCDTDHSTLFYYTPQGLSFRCRHCKGVQVITWDKILEKQQEVLAASSL